MSSRRSKTRNRLEIERILAKRGIRGLLQDLEKRARRVCKPEDEACVRAWIRRHGIGIDLEGVDTPGSVFLREYLKRELGKRVSEIWRERSRRSRVQDLRASSAKTYPPTSLHGLEEWVSHRGVGVDLEGLDAPTSNPRRNLRAQRLARGVRKLRGINRRILERADLDTVLWLLETTGASPREEKSILGVYTEKLEHQVSRAEELLAKALEPVDIGQLYISIQAKYGTDEFYEIKDEYVKPVALWDSYYRVWKLAPGKLKRMDKEEAKRIVEKLVELAREGKIKVSDDKGELSREEAAKRLARLEKLVEKPALAGIFEKDGEPVPDNVNYYLIPYEIWDKIPDKVKDDNTVLYITRYNPSTRSRETIAIHLERNYWKDYYRGVVVPRGLVKLLARDSEKHGVGVPVAPYAPWILDLYREKTPVKLRPYQAEAVASALADMAMYGGSIIQAATGAGKTEMAIDIVDRFYKLFHEKGLEKALEEVRRRYGENEAKRVKAILKPLLIDEKGGRRKPKIFFLSLSTDLLRQFRSRAKKYGLDVGLVTGEEFEIDKPIVAVTVQSLYRALEKAGYIRREKGRRERDEVPEDVKLEEYDVRDPRRLAEEFIRSGLVVFDEVQHVPARTVKAVVSQARPAIKLGLSATPWRDDGRDLEIYGFIGPVADRRVTSTELSKLGYLVPAVILMVHYKDEELKEGEKELAYARGNVWSKVKNLVYYGVARNRWIARLAREMKEKGFSPGLILVKEKKHGRILEKLLRGEGLKAVFVSSEVSPRDREKYFDMLREGRIDYIIATQLADEGLDLPPLRSLILAAGTKSSTRTLQRVGRVIRPWPGKKVGLVIDIVDDVRYMRDHGAKRSEIYGYEKGWTVKTVTPEEVSKELSRLAKG